MIKAKEISSKTQNRKLSDANLNLVLIMLRRKIENNSIQNKENRGLGVFTHIFAKKYMFFCLCL
jgi:hypothetical protein